MATRENTSSDIDGKGSTRTRMRTDVTDNMFT